MQGAAFDFPAGASPVRGGTLFRQILPFRQQAVPPRSSASSASGTTCKTAASAFNSCLVSERFPASIRWTAPLSTAAPSNRSLFATRSCDRRGVFAFLISAIFLLSALGTVLFRGTKKAFLFK